MSSDLRRRLEAKGFRKPERYIAVYDAVTEEWGTVHDVAFRVPSSGLTAWATLMVIAHILRVLRGLGYVESKRIYDRAGVEVTVYRRSGR